MKAVFFALALWLSWTVAGAAQPMVALQTGAGGKTAVTGDLSLLKGSYPPASTFKMLIAQAALEKGLLEPDTKYRCADQGGAELTLAQAMEKSSNDYFRWAGAKLDPADLDRVLEKSGWGGPGARPGIWKSGIERGGDLKVTVEQVHDFTLRLMKGLPDAELNRKLRAALRRPADDGASRVYGKSGAWGGAVWMTGFYEGPGETSKAVTVFVPYQPPQWKPARERALQEFYRLIGQPRPAG